MEDVSAGELARVIQVQHGVASTFVKSVRVHRGTGNRADWNGLVHIFDLQGHPRAGRAFAWSSPIQGGTAPRYFAVLQDGKIATPAQAVKAASAAIRQWGPKGSR